MNLIFRFLLTASFGFFFYLLSSFPFLASKTKVLLSAYVTRLMFTSTTVPLSLLYYSLFSFLEGNQDYFFASTHCAKVRTRIAAGRSSRRRNTPRPGGKHPECQIGCSMRSAGILGRLTGTQAAIPHQSSIWPPCWSIRPKHRLCNYRLAHWPRSPVAVERLSTARVRSRTHRYSRGWLQYLAPNGQPLESRLSNIQRWDSAKREQVSCATRGAFRRQVGYRRIQRGQMDKGFKVFNSVHCSCVFCQNMRKGNFKQVSRCTKGQQREWNNSIALAKGSQLL